MDIEASRKYQTIKDGARTVLFWPMQNMKRKMPYTYNKCYERTTVEGRTLTWLFEQTVQKRDNLSFVNMVTDLNVLCHLFGLNNIQSPPSGIRRVLCFISFGEFSFRACELMNLAISRAYVHSPPSVCVLCVTDIPRRRKISHNFSPFSSGTISLSWE